jgi:hypothetical protein
MIELMPRLVDVNLETTVTTTGHQQLRHYATTPLRDCAITRLLVGAGGVLVHVKGDERHA